MPTPLPSHKYRKKKRSQRFLPVFSPAPCNPPFLIPFLQHQSPQILVILRAKQIRTLWLLIENKIHVLWDVGRCRGKWWRYIRATLKDQPSRFVKLIQILIRRKIYLIDSTHNSSDLIVLHSYIFTLYCRQSTSFAILNLQSLLDQFITFFCKKLFQTAAKSVDLANLLLTCSNSYCYPFQSFTICFPFLVNHFCHLMNLTNELELCIR